MSSTISDLTARERTILRLAEEVRNARKALDVAFFEWELDPQNSLLAKRHHGAALIFEEAQSALVLAAMNP